jgi:hypothetical protein
MLVRLTLAPVPAPDRTYFPQLAILCHNAKVVHAFEANTPEKLGGTQITYRG